MPAITKLFEGLKTENIGFDNIFISRARGKDDHIILKNDMFCNTMHIMSVKKKLDVKYFRIIGESIKSFTFYRKIRGIISNKDYDIIYVDRANIIIGALFAHNGYKVVLRLHGITTYYEYYSKFINRWLNLLKLWSFKAPFKYIICSEDGTPTQQFLAKFSNPKVLSKTLRNGINVIKESGFAPIEGKKLNIPKNVPIILFVGRFSKDKGIMEFVNSMINLNHINNTFYAVIIGEGPLYSDVERIVNDAGLTNVKLLGSVNHKEIDFYYHICDIYVSLNMLGNLSNTVLEAVNTENCIITLKKTDNPVKDHATYNFLKDAALYIDRSRIEIKLPELINKLIANPILIQKQQQKIAECKKQLMSWEERIKVETDILREL
jgi:glycosyltransferase involved in cell wall biosynthesis